MFRVIYENKNLLITNISWLFLWLSIGILPQNLNIKINTYIDLINYFRVYIPVFFTFILLFVIFSKYLTFAKYCKKNFFTTINLFIIYFLFQIIGLYQNSESKFNIENLYLVILAFCAIEILIISQLLNNKKNLEYLLYTALIVCFVSSLYFFFFNFINHQLYSFNDIIEIRLRGYFDANLNAKFFLENVIPRSTGISRTFGLINIFIFIYLIFFNKKNNFLLYFISIIYTSLIWLLDSRGSILIFFTTIILIIYLTKIISFKRKIFLIFYLFILPIILVEIFLISGENFKANTVMIKDKETESSLFSNYKIKNRLFSDFKSSGRIDIWKESLKVFQKEKLFGYGPQGDRFLLMKSEIKKDFFTNSSNALIYSLLSGGYFGISVMFLIYINIIFKIYICLKKIKILDNFNKITLKLSICYIIFFLIRSLFENSFSLFGIDFMMFILSATYIENYLKNIRLQS